MKEPWHITSFEKKAVLKNPILIVGLPGIGNVGKIVVDFLIDELKAKKMYEIHSRHFPNTVFVNDNNLVSLPSVEIFCKKALEKLQICFLWQEMFSL
jgi:proteasome assembly chaperone (PAC2) family protein